MRFMQYELSEPAGATGTGAVQNVSELQNKYIQAGSLTGTVKLEGSLDGTVWSDLIATITNGVAAVPATVYAVRLNRTAGAKAGTFLIAGHEVRGNA